MTRYPPKTLDALRQALSEYGYQEVTDSTLDAVAAQVEHLVFLPLEEPTRHPEFCDLLVILPEILHKFEQAGLHFHIAFGQGTLAKRFGIVRHPSLVFLRKGQYIGTLAGLLDWHEYLSQFAQLRQQAPRPKSQILSQGTHL